MSNLKKSCVICNTEFVALRSDAEVCSAKCRQKNWRKKQEALVTPAADIPAFDIEKLNQRIKELEWVGKTEEWCKAKGFPTSELIEKYEGLEIFKEETNTLLIEKEVLRVREGQLLEKIKGLEAENGRLLSGKFIDHFVEGQNKPNTASKPYDGQLQGARMPIKDDLPTGSEPLADFKARIKTNAGKSDGKKLNSTTVEESGNGTPKNKPSELSPFLKSRQSAKNNMK